MSELVTLVPVSDSEENGHNLLGGLLQLLDSPTTIVCGAACLYLSISLTRVSCL